MARKPRHLPNAKDAQQKFPHLANLLTRGLAAVGAPIYLLFSLLFIFLVLFLSILGRFAINFVSTIIHQIVEFLRFVNSFTSEKLPAYFKRTRKKILKKLRRRKPFFRQIDLSSYTKILKLESLRIRLLRFKVLSKIKRIFTSKLSRFQKLKLRRKIIFLLLIFLLLSLAFYFYFAILRSLPRPSELTEKTPQVSTKIYDRNGNLLYKIYKDENRSIIPLSHIPIHVRLSTLAAEDAEFYENPGFSIKGIFRALVQNTKSGTVQGGSTITQQLVKNVLLSPEKTLTRKVKEIILSVEVEATYTKDQILEMYLNQVSYGGTAYGIEEASREYFGKSVADLSLSEAAFLAGLTKSPTSYSPYGQNPELGMSRQREILNLMVINKYITREQADKASNEKLIFIPNKDQIEAPHFVMFIRSLLVEKYGEDMVEKGGLEVTTSLDLPIQELAQNVVTTEVSKLRALNVGNGAALVINPTTGEILSMVGSADYFDKEGSGQVNVTDRLRQPGSSIKIVNYTYALEHGGYTAASVINDSPITYVVPGSKPYSPVNYDGKFKGNVTVRTALAESRNIPAVKILASYGVGKMVTQGQSMGIRSWNDPSRFGLSLTLGGGAVTALDMARVYSTLANYGKTPILMPILTVKDYKGRVLEKNLPQTTQVVDPRIAFLITNILSDNNARAPEFGFNSYLVVPGHPEVAVKTGTSNELRDNWTNGYNQDYLVIAWVGNNDNAPMSRIASGVTGASPIWNKIMSTLLQDKNSIDWNVPEGMIKINCIGAKSEWFLKEKVLPNFCKPNPTPTPAPEKNQNQILEGVSTQN